MIFIILDAKNEFMLIEEEFKAIYLNYKIRELIPFLKKRTPKDKKEIVAVLKKFLKKDWGHNDISMVTALACSKTEAEYQTIASAYYSVPLGIIEELFEFYVPEWIGESYFFLRNVDYLKILEWEHKNLLTLHKEVAAWVLSDAIGSKNTTEEILFTYPATITAHIALLFEYESNITGHYNNGRNWKDILTLLVGENKIKRSSILKSSLNAVSLNFSKDHTIWFLELFSNLKPSNQEVLTVQDELFSIFTLGQNSLHLPVLKIINPVVTEKQFKTNRFLYAVEPLMMLTVKTILNALLQILDKIIKTDENVHEEICLLLLPIFLNKEMSLQNKAAKIIEKYGNSDSEEIRKGLKLYGDSLLSDTQSLLGKFLSQDENPEEKIDYNIHKTAVWHESQEILRIETMDDFVFFAAQVFNNYEPYHFDLFLDAIVRCNSEMTQEYLEKLEPAFKLAIKSKNKQGLSHLLATFFIQYGLWKQKKMSSVLLEAQSEFPRLKDWIGKRTPSVYIAYHKLLTDIFDVLKENKNLPVLCISTHTPCWIDIKILINKLTIYQDQKEEPIAFDLEIAVLKVRRENVDQAEKYAVKYLNKEYLKYLEPIFNSDYFNNKYDKAYLNGDFHWKLGVRKIYKGNHIEEVSELPVSIINPVGVSTDLSFLDCVFNSYRGVYNDDYIHFLYTIPYFSGSLFAKKYNETQSNTAYQYDGKGNAELLNAWMKLELPFQKMHYLFLSVGLLNKDKAFCGTAFEVLINKAVSDDFDLAIVGLSIAEKINFGLAQIKKLADGISDCINLSPKHNLALEKLIISILTAIKNPVFNLKKLLLLYYELMKLNHSSPGGAIMNQLEEWKKENNLKIIIHQIKD